MDAVRAETKREEALGWVRLAARDWMRCVKCDTGNMHDEDEAMRISQRAIKAALALGCSMSDVHAAQRAGIALA